MLGQAGATGAPGATGTALKDAAPSASYAGKLIARIKPNILLTETVPGNPAADVEVRASATGTILSRRLVKSSGSKDGTTRCCAPSTAPASCRAMSMAACRRCW